MGNYSVADAKNRLPELIDNALKGENVVITRHGQPVVELRPISKPARKITAAALDWLAERRVGKRAREDAGALVSRMRDEDERRASTSTQACWLPSLPITVRPLAPTPC
jgi:prevent-host-death family protein